MIAGGDHTIMLSCLSRDAESVLGKLSAAQAEERGAERYDISGCQSISINIPRAGDDGSGAGCIRTIEGAEEYASIMSYISTARKQGVANFEAVKQALSGNALAPAEQWR